MALVRMWFKGRFFILNLLQVDRMVLLRLYLHHSLAEFGGVNPRPGVFRSGWATENSDREKVIGLEGTNAALYEIEGGNQIR
jgi:hypothetical protein